MALELPGPDITATLSFLPSLCPFLASTLPTHFLVQKRVLPNLLPSP